VIWRIEAYQPLPDLGRKFDVITAHMICFNGHKSDKLWKISEWEYFLDDLAAISSRRTAQVCLELNREYDDSLYTPELRLTSKRAVPRSTPARLLQSIAARACRSCDNCSVKSAFRLRCRRRPQPARAQRRRYLKGFASTVRSSPSSRAISLSSRSRSAPLSAWQ